MFAMLSKSGYMLLMYVTKGKYSSMRLVAATSLIFISHETVAKHVTEDEYYSRRFLLATFDMTTGRPFHLC